MLGPWTAEEQAERDAIEAEIDAIEAEIDAMCWELSGS